MGLLADKWEVLSEAYKEHSRLNGFSIRKNGLRRVADGVPEYERYFECSCAGDHNNGKKNDSVRSGKKKVLVTRTFCQAGCCVNVNNDGLWEVVFHNHEHNHPMTPLEWQHYHRSERRISEAERKLIKAMTEARVKPTDQFRIASATVGEDEFVGHTKRDHINFVNRLKMKAIEGGDASTLLNMLSSRQAKESGVFFRVEFDTNGRLYHLFWRDSMMKADYQLYHDVLIFDTTYRTNRYNLICGALVGVNNHWSNVMFGCAFLSNENEESFTWLFNAFKESMKPDVGDEGVECAKHPVSIFTDQDPYGAMKNAIQKCFPTSRHRLCQWHIQQNAMSHFGNLKTNNDFQKIFKKCMTGCYSPGEFEVNWAKMLADHSLHSNDWFKRLYDLREKWSTAFNKDYFSAGILSSQRSESTNHAISFQATKTTSLTEFYHIFEATIKRWRDDEGLNEFKTIKSTSTSLYPMVDLVKHASQVYTLDLYWKFENEFNIAMGARVSVIETVDSIIVYGVDPPGVFGSTHRVVYDCSTAAADCSCKKFQEMGILCFHILRVFHMLCVSQIPTQYILRRWTKFAKEDIWATLRANDKRCCPSNGAVSWRRSLLTKVHHLLTKCENDPGARQIVDDLYSTANVAVGTYFKSKDPPQEASANGVGVTEVVLDPIRVVTKGRSQRKKPMSGKKTRGKKRKVDAGGMQEEYIQVARLV